MEYSTTPIDLVQFNTEAVVPFFASTKGYGILWDNNARSILNPPSVPPISVQNGRNETKSIPFVPAVDGDYIFSVNSCSDYGCGMNHYLSLVIVADNDPSVDTQTIQYWDELTNLPDSISGRAKNLVSKEKVYGFFQSSIENVSLYAITPFAASSTTSLRSRLGSNIDYYFVWQPTRNSLGGDIAGNSSTKPGIAMGGVEGSEKYSSIDMVIAGYRRITGSAPLYSRWVYGFWQCKEHYHNQTELLDAATKFRRLGIPVDAFVQDWHYWGNLGWGPSGTTRSTPIQK